MKQPMWLCISLLFMSSMILLGACTDSRPLPRASNPSWSPDGQQIAYVCFMEGPVERDRANTVLYSKDAGDICVMNYDGTNKRRLVRKQGADDAGGTAADKNHLDIDTLFLE